MNEETPFPGLSRPWAKGLVLQLPRVHLCDPSTPTVRAPQIPHLRPSQTPRCIPFGHGLGPVTCKAARQSCRKSSMVKPEVCRCPSARRSNPAECTPPQTQGLEPRVRGRDSNPPLKGSASEPQEEVRNPALRCYPALSGGGWVLSPETHGRSKRSISRCLLGNVVLKLVFSPN